MSVIACMAPVAERQHGLAHRRQLLAAGVTRARLEHALARGELERVLPEVYRLPGAPRTWRQDVMAAVLDAGPGAAASHRTAAVLLAVAHRDAKRLVEITVERQPTARIPGVIVHP